MGKLHEGPPLGCGMPSYLAYVSDIIYPLLTPGDQTLQLQQKVPL